MNLKALADLLIIKYRVTRKVFLVLITPVIIDKGKRNPFILNVALIYNT